MFRFSICIIVKNEERIIARCLESIRDLSDDIIIVDSFSKDKTIEIAKQFNNINIFQNKWHGYSIQRNFAHTKAKYDWIFWFDADEVISKELYNELKNLNPEAEIAAYKIPRLDFFYGRWIKHGDWYPQYHENLYNKRILTWDENMIVHEKLISKNKKEYKIGFLKSPLLHFSHITINDTIEGFMNYTDLEAIKLYKEKKEVSNFALLLEMWLQIIKQFFGRYFLKQGFRDGIHGFIIACLMSFYKFLQYSKLIIIKYITKNKERIKRDKDKYSIDLGYYKELIEKDKKNK